MSFKSIRWRIQIWHTLLLGLIVATLLYAFHRHQREIIYQALDHDLREPIVGIIPHLTGLMPAPADSPPPRHRRHRDGPNSPPRSERPLPRGFHPPDSPPPVRNRRPHSEERLQQRIAQLTEKDFYLVAWQADGTESFRSPNYPANAPDPFQPHSRGYSTRTVGSFREITHTSPGRRTLVVGTDTSEIEQQLDQLALKLLGIGSSIVGGGLLVGWFLTGRSLRPIGTISKTAQKIARGELSRRIEEDDTDSELGDLSRVLNETFAKLEQSFDQQIRFTADASHEIRTPISVILAKSQFALSKERSAEKYREALQTCAESAQHMRTLTDSLLELSRIDSGQFHLHPTPGDLADLAHSIIEMLTPLAEKHRLSIETELSPTPAHFDHQRLRQVLINLLGNAIKYNHEQGTITLTTRPDNSHPTIIVHNTGPGISPEDLPHIFDRFYRADKARTTNKEGSTGLGLAITKAIIEAHQGQIFAQSSPEEGTTFTIQLPHRDSIESATETGIFMNS